MRLDTKLSGLIGGAIGLIGAVGLAATGSLNGPASEGASKSERSAPTSGPSSGPSSGPASPISLAPAQSDDPDAVCLLSDAPFFNGLTQGCYTRASLTELLSRDLVNDRGANVEVTLSSPPEAPAATDKCRTCDEYNRLERLGWFALTGRDQRREEYFRRACGMLNFLIASGTPERTNFEDGLLSFGDIAALPDEALLRFAPAPDAAARENAREADSFGNWTVDMSEETITIQPLAHADFDGDARGDMLVYMRTRKKGATAFAGTVAYLAKTDDGIVSVHTK